MNKVKHINLLVYITRSYMTLLAGAAILLGAHLSGGNLTESVYWILALAQSLVVAAVFQWNEITDKSHDRLSLVLKPVADGTLASSRVLLLVVCEIGIALTLGLLCGPITIIALTIQIILALGFYSSLKTQYGLAGNILTAALFGMVPSLGASLTGDFTLSILSGVIALLFITGREIIKDVLDVVPDRFAKRRTIPLMYGEEVARNSGLILMAMSMLATLCLLSSRGSILGIVLALGASVLLVATYYCLLNKSPRMILWALRFSAACLGLGMFSMIGLR